MDTQVSLRLLSLIPCVAYKDLVEILRFLLPHLPASLLSETNSAKSPPIHWAVSNNHVPIVKLFAEHPPDKSGGLPLFKVRALRLLRHPKLTAM